MNAWYRGTDKSDIQHYIETGSFYPSDYPIVCDEVLLDEMGCFDEYGELLPECSEYIELCNELRGKVINVTSDLSNAEGYGDCIISVNRDLVFFEYDVYGMVYLESLREYGKDFVIYCPELGFYDLWD